VCLRFLCVQDFAFTVGKSVRKCGGLIAHRPGLVNLRKILIEVVEIKNILHCVLSTVPGHQKDGHRMSF
jgi:hypothetical protein